MIWLVIFYFLAISIFCAFLLSGALRDYTVLRVKGIVPAAHDYYKGFVTKAIRYGVRKVNAVQDQSYQQQVLILVAGIFLIAAPTFWMATRETSLAPLEENQNNPVDAQIYALLEGEMLVPPPEIDAELIVAAEAIAQQAEAIVDQSAPTATPIPMIHAMNLRSADRKWDKINPRYAQRLLLVFKIMKERHGYDMVLLEGYRSPQRQNMLAGQGSHVTQATGYRSYHQFGLAADVAFMRNGKVVITEKDPWAMQGYKYYGEAAESVGLVWGGRWKMMDLGHTEFRMKGILGKPEMAQKLTAQSGMPLSALE